MTEKNTIALIIVALIGAIGVILAACIGLIPTILPLVRSTSTPLVFITAIAVSDTPAPATPSATNAPTDLPTMTATFTPQTPPTDTPTTIVTPAASSSEIDDYVGEWINIDSEPGSEKVKLIITHMEISRTGDTTANISVCRATQDAEEYVQPDPAPATMFAFGLAARDLAISGFENLRWAVIVQRSGDKLVATVQEYDTNNILLDSDTFQFEKPSLFSSLGSQPCENSPATPTP